MSIIVPLVYGEKQKRIMLEEHGDFIRENPNKILFDKFHGEILKELFFDSGHYQKNLEFLLEQQPKLEERLRDYLSGNLRLIDFEEKEVLIDGERVLFEISHNPRVATGYKNSFYTTIAFFSELLEKTSKENLNFNPNIIEEAKEKIAFKIEKDRNLHFMPDPFAFSFEKNRKKWMDEIFTPPFSHVLRENHEKVDPGMYVTITGISGLKSLFEKVGEFGMKLYCPPFTSLEGADNSRGPDFVSNKNIRYQFARTGWSTVSRSHTTETPLIAPAYIEGDDPEIFFNEKTMESLGLATIFDGSNYEEAIEKADSLRPRLCGVNSRLINRYGTLDGIAYTSKVIIDFLEGKDISRYRNIKPEFKGK